MDNKFAYDLNFRGEILAMTRAVDEAGAADLAYAKADANLRFLTGFYARGREYSQFMVAAGYAAFLTLWAGTAKDLAVETRLLSGGLLGASLVVFVTFEIVRMYGSMQDQKLLSGALWEAKSKGDLDRLVSTVEAQMERNQLVRDDLWPLAFYGSTVPGLLGAGLLTITLLAKVAFG